MAQYAILIYAPDSAHAPEATSEDIDSCDRHSDELVESGSMLLAYALTPRDMATSIRDDMITDGPFVDAKEIVAGFYVIRGARPGRGPGDRPAQPRCPRGWRRRGPAGAQRLPRQ